MDNIYILMIAALAILAIADLVVGVSNEFLVFHEKHVVHPNFIIFFKHWYKLWIRIYFKI